MVHPGGQKARTSTAADALRHHLDELSALVHQGATGSGAVSGAQRMLLAGKRNELGVVRAQLSAEFDRTRAQLRARSPGKVGIWDQFTAQVNTRFERLDRALAAVDVDRGEQRGPALEHLRQEIELLHDGIAQREMAPPMERMYNMRQAAPPAHRPTVPSATRPEYLTDELSARRSLLASLTPPPTAPQAASCNYTAADLAATPDAPQAPEIQALAGQLGYSVANIFQYVSNNIEFQPYYGSLKGALATYYAQAGGPTDQASLLIALLRASNVPARYVRGVVQMNEVTPDANGGRIARWIGAKSYRGAMDILGEGEFNSALVANASGSAIGVQFNHVWVEACVPYGHYRGASIDSSGERWIPLDPSYKDKTYQPGIATSVSFDYTGYLAARQNGPDSLPNEIFAQAVEAAVRSSDPNLTVEDVPYTGYINPIQLDLLPASLPFEVVTFTNWPGTSSPETAQLPSAHRYRFSIGGLGLSSAYSLYLPDTALSRITLYFKGSTQADQTALASWYGDGSTTSTAPCTINVVPALLVNGQDQGVSGASVGLCTTGLTLALGVHLDEVSTGALNGVTYTNIAAANWHALRGYAFEASDTLLAKQSAALLATVNSTPNPNASTATLDSTQGQFLHLVLLKYLRYLTDAIAQLGALNGESGQSGNHIGLTSTQAKVAYVFDLPYAVERSGFLVDVRGGLSLSIDLASGQQGWDNFKLSAYAGSAYESYMWQENANLDAVSTVRGLQFANQTGVGTITATAANWSTVRPQLSVYPGVSAEDCTYNTSTPQYPRCLIDSTTRAGSIQSLISNGFSVTLPKSLLQYDDWKGYVYAAELQNTTGTACNGAPHCIVMAIDKLAGGYSLGQELSSDTYDATLASGSINVNTAPLSTQSTNSISGATNNQSAANGTNLYITTAGDPVNMATGNMYYAARDLAIKGRGHFPLVFERSYNSRIPSDGPLGFGWTHSFNHFVKLYGVEGGLAKLSWTDATGGEKFFATSNHSNGNITAGSTIPNPSGIFVVFQRLADGTFSIQEKNGLTYRFESATGPSGTPGPGTPPVVARLLSMTDRNGNALTLSYNASCGNNLCSVSDALGRTLSLSYSGNHLTQMSDFSGRRYQFGYDINENLTSVQNPLALAGTQNPVTYSYYTASDGSNLNHLMRQYTLSRGNGMHFEYYANGRTFRHTVVMLGGTLSPDQVNIFTYNDFRRETVQTNERHGQRHYFFDPNGNALNITEENGAEYTYTYDCVNPSQSPGSPGCLNPFNRISKTDPSGYQTHFAYDGNGNVTRVTTPRGATKQYFDFNSFNSPRRIQDENGHWTILRYDSRGNLTDEIHTAAGYVPPTCSGECAIPPSAQILSWTVNGYDSVGNLTSTKRVRDIAGQVANNTPTSNTGPLLTYSFDTNHLNITTQARTGIQNTGTSATTVNSATLSYDVLGRLTAGVDAHWYPTQFGYDALDRVIQASDTLGNLRSVQFDANNNPIGQQLTLPANGVPTLIDSSSVLYDDSDRKSKATDAGGGVTTYTYDAAGNAIGIQNPDGYSLAFEYDAANRVVRAYDEESHSVATTRDTSGRVRTVTDPNGNVTTSSYWDSSGDGRLKLVTLPQITNNGTGPVLTNGRAMQYAYDAVGNTISVTEIPAAGSGQANRTSSTTYDELNRPVRLVGPQYTDATFGAICPVVVNTYDTLGRLTQVAAGRTPSPCSNAAVDVTAVQITYAFDDFDHEVRQTDALGRIWTFSYDNHDNIATKVDPKSQTTTYTWARGSQLQSRQEQGGRTTTYQRNALGQPLQSSYPVVSYTYTYDASHRLASVTDGRGGKSLKYSWSPGGWLNTITDSDGYVTNYLYDPVGRLSGITGPNGDTVNVSFDAGGRLQERDMPNGNSSRYQYNEDNSIREIVNITPGGNVTSQHDYTYDGVGNRSSQAENVGGSIINYGYTYDALKRLTQVTNGTAAQQQNYTYDPLGNRITQSVGQTSPVVTAYKYDAANELTEIHSGSITGALLASLAYDYDGNITSDGTRTYTWDTLNQLTQVTNGTTTVAYGYDDQGRRIKKTVGSSVVQWLYLGTDIYAEYGSSWNAPTALYTGGNDLPLVRAAFSNGTFAQAKYYFQDALDSVVAIDNNTNNTVETERFDAWGNKIAGTTVQSDQYGYTGREPDETGLIYYRARYYSPSIGRFVSQDPLGLTVGLNSYSYANDNPVNANDPSGDCPQCVAGAVVGGVGGLLMQGAIDLYHWRLSSFATYAGSVVGGVAGGVAAVNCGPTCAGAAAGAASSLTTQGINALEGNVTSLWDATSNFVASTVLGAVGGKVAGTVVPAVFKDVLPSVVGTYAANQVKGAIGESLTSLDLTLSGQGVADTHVSNGVGRSTFDFLTNGETYVESKFGTSSLSSPQRQAASQLGDSFQLQQWDYPKVSGLATSGPAAAVGSDMSSGAAVGGSSAYSK